MGASRPQRILLGVTGGIAAYKSADLVRRLRERDADVQVVMTAGAEQFITALTLQALSGRTVRTSLWDEAAEAAMGHIELARWADAILVAPATADFLARLAHGLANDLLTTLCLATEAPVMVAPAMNHQMWANAATQANLRLLKERGIKILGPAAGEQACGEVGLGRMLEPTEIAAELYDKLPATAGSLQGMRVVITAGPTRECIDPVRFISNRSSGKMGYAVAEAARDAGAEVVLVSGPVSLPSPANICRVEVESAQQMLAAVNERIGSADIFIATAAVSDYCACEVAGQKIKKTNDTMTLSLTRTPDVLATVSKLPNAPFVVGFAAETEQVEKYALAKMSAKHLDMIAANQVGQNLAFDKDENALTVYWPGGSRQLSYASKRVLAQQLIELIAERYRASKSGAARAKESLANAG